MTTTRTRLGKARGRLAIIASWLAMVSFSLASLSAGAAAPGSPEVQAGPRLSSLQIEIWPEFDRRQTALVILRGELAANTVLPTTVSLRIPASSGGPAAVAFSATADGELLNLGYERTNAADFITLRLQILQRFFHVEFYDPLAAGTPDRSYSYVWPGDLATGRLTVRIQQPATASGFSVQPEIKAGSAGPNGLLYWAAELGALAAGKPLPIEIRYAKTDARTSAEILGLKMPDAPPAPSTVTSGGLPWSLLIFAVTLVLVVATALGITWWWRRRGSASSARSSGDGFCPKCGGQLASGDRFCSGCGAPARKK